VTDERPSARVYANLRTAHLERFAQMAPASVFFQSTRYDYDESLVPAKVLLRQVTRRGAVAELARTPYRVVEVNEPLTTNRWFDVLAQVVAVRLRARLNGRPQRIVAYCIGNADPALEISRRWRLPLPVARLVSRFMVRLLVIGIDRLAFGTSGSLEMYAGYAGTRRLERKSRTFEALPAACACLDSTPVSPALGRNVVFVGAFDDHKGIRQVLAAWDEIRRHRPELQLRLVGKGRLVDDVARWAATRPEVSLDVDPPRSRIHEVLREATALILPSQRRGTWREQIGLPILEGLAHGCEIVTTTETGLADWLAANGHAVVAPECGTEVLAATVLRAVDDARKPSDILADLPTVDRRIEADHWLMG
jgi:glycosyltransferase involved in cell wall biosynthesis